jgi:transketolase
METYHLERDQLVERIRHYRAQIVEMIAKAGSGHPGGSLSAIDLIAALFHRELRFRPGEPEWQGRDRFVLSKGHGVPALYAVMAGCGFFPAEELHTLRRLGARLQGHPSCTSLPGIEASTGSLGMGLSFAMGAALGLKESGQRVYCLMGDGEIQEGQIWEAALAAPKFRLGNLVAIVDYNKGQIDGPTREVMDLEPLAEKWRAFNWQVLEIDGHDLNAIEEAFSQARSCSTSPSLILAHTVKGKGVSFMEGVIDWHGTAPDGAQCAAALAELKG